MFFRSEGVRQQIGWTLPTAAAVHGGHCPPYAPSGIHHKRRGVILLVVMVLLTLMTLMGLTLVLVTSQGRLSALAASRKALQADHDSSELSSVITQVAVGSTDPNSSFGAHGLVEDLYGLPQFFGRIAPATAGPTVLPVGETLAGAAYLAGGNNGTLLQLTVIAAGTPNSTAAAQQYVLPTGSGAFCGDVITMLTGPAAGQSARVVGYYFNPTSLVATMQVSSFGGVVPHPGDEFMINGRPFSGTGFGLNLSMFQGGGPWAPPSYPAGTLPLLTAYEAVPSATSAPSFMPYAYLPNHARIGLTPWLPTGTGTYWDLAGPGGANEPYDAPDFQNMMLAMHYYSTTSAKVITPIPSLHRPELVAWYYSQANGNTALGIPANPAMSMGNPNMRRKVILRPEPTDHYFVDTNGNSIWDAREPFYDSDGNGAYTPAVDPFLDLNGDQTWTPGETDYAGNTFNPVTGCWYIAANGTWAIDPFGSTGLDIDNDKDGIADSIWVDPGLPVHTESDGTFTKNLAAVLCIDLDGKVNLNATGALAQLDPYRYQYPNPYNPWSGTDNFGNTYTANTVSGPLSGGGTGAVSTYKDPVERNLPVGQGYGPADVNPLQVFRRNHPLTPLPYYTALLLGFDGYTPGGAVAPIAAFDGRYGESTRLTLPQPAGSPFFKYPGVYPPGSYGNSLTVPTLTQMILGGPRPGWSQWFDPYITSLLPPNAIAGSQNYWVNDSVALARFSDFRPGLLAPPGNATPFFFDFLALNTPSHVPTGHGTPSDLHSRGFVATDLAGRPYYLGTATIPWLTLPATWSSTMTDLAAVQYDSGALAFLSAEVTLNEGVDTPYELDLTQHARRGGQNTGNTINGVPDFAAVDAKLTGGEGEAILRSHERGTGGVADTSNLTQRLDAMETAGNFLATGSTAQQTTTLGADSVRLAVATESWDLPVPNIALTPQQMQDITEFANRGLLGSTLGNSLSLNVGNVSFTDLARARIYSENAGNPNFATSGSAYDADWALFGNLQNITQITTPLAVAPGVPVWPLLAPETVLGMRLNINRLLGNGQDDNLNGVIDDPAEVFWQDANGMGESLRYPFSLINNGNLTPGGQVNPATGMNNLFGVLDLNNDGFYPVSPVTSTTSIDPQLTLQNGNPFHLPADLTGADMRARQLLARHLYVTMMLLIDDRNVSAQIYNYNSALAVTPQAYPLQAPGNNAMLNTTPPIPPNMALAGRVQVAYLIAQWAINAVDFRDRDSIMTPFEFDIFPFQADNSTTPNVTWNVDDIVGPANSGLSLDDTPNPAAVAPVPNYLWRGLVWGCERPELLLTETLAFHDRGTDDTKNAPALDNGKPDTYTADPNVMPVANLDTDYDQVRRPRGSLIFELLNTTSYWDAPQYDLQYEAAIGTTASNNQPWQQNGLDGNGNGGAGAGGYGINLAQVASSQQSSPTGPTASPVWRVVIAYSPWYSESTFYGNSPGAYGTNLNSGTPAALDPRVPTIPANYIHRAVYFTPYQQTFNSITPPGSPWSAAIATTDSFVNELPRGRSFFADPDVFSAAFAAVNPTPVPATLMLPPSQYALVGSAAPNMSAATNYVGVNTVYLGLNQTTPGAATNSNYQFLLLGNTTGSANGVLGTPAYNTIATWMQNTGGALTAKGPYLGGYGVTVAATATVKPVIGVPIQTNWLNAAGQYLPHSQAFPATPATTLRMSLSEPEYGYPVWNSASSNYWDDGFYYSQPGTVAPGYSFAQHPFDSDYTNQYLPTVPGNINKPNNYVAPDGTTNGPNMTTNYTVLYLQRLANPLAAWDAAANPYITVDSMPVDLAAYTGENLDAGTTNKALASAFEPTKATGQIMNSSTPAGPMMPTSGTAYANGIASATVAFDSRRRGYDPKNPTQMISTQGIANIWAPIPINKAIASGQYGTMGGTITAPVPNATLGYLNTEYGTYYSTATPPTVGGVATANQYYGDPQLSMPWYTWNNRPYISQYELMLVPASTPSTMTSDFGMLGWQSSGATPLVNGTPNMGEFQPSQPTANMLPAAQFMNLLNFFDNQQPPVAFTSGNTSYIPNLYRIFEFVQVPSQFAGTQDLLNPSQFAGSIAAQAANTAAPGVMPTVSHLFHPPFNWLPRYREPGKINLNTIFDPVVFRSLMDDYPGTMTTGTVNSLWTQFLYSRQGFATLPLSLTDPVSPLNPPNPVAQFFNNSGVPSAWASYPTYFANPFRPDGSGAFVPPTSWNPITPPVPVSLMMQQWSYPGSGSSYNGVNATLLRSQGANSFPGPTATPGSLALFDDTAFDTNNPSTTTYKTGSLTAYRNAGRNAAFQYQMFNRLGNTTTNRSNVYAIWVTLGKFKVQPVAVSPQNPDGYKLLSPYLDAAGNQVQQRGFYIFDRSIPMGCQRGQDVNTERGMLLEHVLQ
jgi:hypothetical protein